MSLLAELKRRNVFRVGAAYAIVAWLLIQVADTAFPALKLPDWTLTFVTVLLIMGFPLALIFAWAFELTPEGMKRTRDAAISESLRHATGRKLDFLLIGLLLVALAVVVLDSYVLDAGAPASPDARVDESARATASSIRSLAVLPLENLSGDPEQEYFADGMTEALIGDLAKIGALRVISRTSAMRYKGSDKSLPEIARELGVDAVIEGTVMRDEGRVRISAQLIDGRSDEHLWSERYDRDLRDVLLIHADVAHAIAKQIRINLAPSAELRLARARAFDPEVEDEYLKGRFHWHERGASLRQAVAHYRRALELDPTFVPAWAGMASAFSIFDVYQLEPARKTLAKAEAAARRALELDDSNAEALAALGMVMLSKELDLASGLRQIHRAVALDPDDVFVRTRLASALGAVGRFRDADEHFLRARELDPLSAAVRYMHAENYRDSGDLESAIREYGRSLELDPKMALSRRGMGWAYVSLGDLDRAEEEFARLGPDDSVGCVGLAWVYAQRGDRKAALRWASKVGDDELALPDVARLYAFLGERDRAFEALDLAFRKWAPTLAWVLVAGIQGRNELSALRDDPRFENLAGRVRLPEAEPAS